MGNTFKPLNSAMVALMIGAAVASPSPAHAGLFGSLFGGLLGGGSEGGGGCSASDALALAGGAVAGPVGAVAGGAAGKAASGGGCPVVEDAPLAVQHLTEEQRDELIKQGEELVRMDAPSTMDLSGDIVGGVLAGGDQAKAVGLEWSPDAADGRFAEQYPESYAGMMPEQMAAHSDAQATEARDATRTSKRTTSAALSDIIDNIPTELDTLNAALRDCEGINCSVQVMAQMVGLSIKVGVLNAVMDAGHYRAAEAMSDTLFSAREQAMQDRRLDNGEMGGTSDSSPDTPPDEPPEVVYDPSVPTS
jgi:hypothetical protein